MTLHLTNQLRRSINDDPSLVVLFVGAGLSASGVRSDGTGLPDWDTLILQMIEDLRDADNCDAQHLVDLKEMVRQGKHLQAAFDFKRRTRPDQFAAFLKQSLDPPDLCSSTLHEIILKIPFRGIITTNFDMVFEHQSNRLQPLVYPQFLNEIDSFRRPGFFAKIHGCIRKTGNIAENLILTEEGYESLRINPKYKIILHSLFVMHPVLTVGFSLRDPDFNGILADLKEALGENMPTIYSLMYRSKRADREAWRNQGVEILPYTDHADLIPFFNEILALSEAKHPAQQLSPSNEESQIDYENLLNTFGNTQTIEEMFELIAEQMKALPDNAQRETFLFQLLALIEKEDQFCLAPHLVSVSTKSTDKALLSLFKGACRGDKLETKNRLARLKPHALHASVRTWAMENWQNIVSHSWRGEPAGLFTWLLDQQWADQGIALWDAFFSLLNQIMSMHRRNALSDLYEASEHLEGAQERIEKMVLAPGFVRSDDSEQGGGQRRWYKSWDQEIVRYVEEARVRHILNDSYVHSNYADLVLLGQNKWYWRIVAKRLLTEYVHRTHLTLHSFSGSWNPEKANEILEVLASVRDTESQLHVLWEINHWPEDMRGLISLGEDFERLREGLFVPLWWRYSSETRVKYLEGGPKRRMHQIMPDLGQEFLLTNMMGLTYDPDKDFREAFLASSEEYKSSRKEDGYDPNFMMQVWRGRELSYSLSEEVPAELVRRVATNRAASESFEPETRWNGALQLAQSALRDNRIRQYVSAERKDYVIDNLLGAYAHKEARIILYTSAIKMAAEDLNLETDVLGTIVYIHETVHAFSHLGKDRDGYLWVGFSSPEIYQPNLDLSTAHESLAQYYTFKLLEYLGDERLLKAFSVLEEHCLQVYRVWRATKNYSLEQMRQVLIDLRRKGTDWPPWSRC